MATPQAPPGGEAVEWLAWAFQSGWLTAAIMALIVVYLYRELRNSERARFAELSAQNKLADRVTSVMERLERKAERRDYG